MQPFFSIIMPSTLADYKGAAKNRDQKIVRAIESVISQSFVSWELIVVADGCEKTFQTIEAKYLPDERTNCLLIPKFGGWGATARNVGKTNAKGHYIVYIDNDDVWGSEHLSKVYNGLVEAKMPPAAYFDDLLSQPDRSLTPIPRKCKLKKGSCGTSNIAFHRELPVSWEDETYLHDWVFIQSLMKYGLVEIPPAEYIVCHVPNPHKPLDV